MKELNAFERTLYQGSQSMRVAWYMAHYAAALRQERKVKGRGKPAEKSPEKPSEKPQKEKRSFPSRARIFRDMGRLFKSDMKNVDEGIYPMPWREDGSLLTQLARSRKYFKDLPGVARRRAAEKFDEFADEAVLEDKPAYYTRNFHFQTDGYLSEDSAALYDLQVEALFSGTANAMRRQAIRPIAEFMTHKDQRSVKLLDVACGTGRFLRALLEAYPRMPVTGLDLSRDYLNEARSYLKHRRKVNLVEANAEDMPGEDETYDMASCIYLFHELPPKIREKVASQIARVIKPGGLFVFVDSLQYGDVAGDYDGLLDMFPERFHEPFYTTYAKTDLTELFGQFGLKRISEKPIFLSKMMVFQKV